MSEPHRAPLFREEAVQGFARRLEGGVLLGAPPAALLLAPLLVALLGGGGLFAAWARYARTESVRGYLGPDGGVRAIVPERPGAVRELRVRLGERVAAGDVLMDVASGSALAGGAGVEAAIRAELLAQRREHETRLELGQARHREQQQRQRERLDALARQIGQLESLRFLAADRWSLAAERSKRSAQLLARGVVSVNQHEQERDAALVLRREIREIEATLLERQDERARLRAEIRTAPLEHREHEAELRLRISEIETRLREVEGRSSYAITSPVAGRVAALQAAPGSQVAPDVPVAVIAPEGGELQAQLLVPTRAAGLIELGQSVGLKYAAFPYPQFGIQRARIARIESAVLRPAELRAPVSVQEPVYRVVAALEAQSVQAFGRSYPLQPGMLLDAEIVLEKRSLLEWILEPLYSLRGAPASAPAS
jgi:membrane fusion protein